MSDKRPRLILLAATMAALCLAVIQLGYEPLWLDEAVTFYLSQLPADELVVRLRGWLPPLYFAVMKIWTAFGDSSEFWLRLFSALCFTLTVPLVYVIGRTMSGRRDGLYAACLVATAPFLIRYAQEARMYAMLTFFCSLALMSAALIISRQSDRRPAVIGEGLRGLWRRWHRRDDAKAAHRGGDDALWAMYIVAVLGGMFSHSTAVLLPVVTTLIFLTAIAAAPTFRWLRLRNLIAANAAVFALYVFYIPLLLNGIQTSETLFKPTLVSLLQIIKTLVRTYANEHVPVQAVAMAALGALALWGWRRRKDWKWIGFTLAATLGLPMLLFIMSAVLREVFFARILIWASVPFYVACAVGLARLPGVALRRIILIGLLLCNLYGILNEHKIIREPWDQVTDAAAQVVSSDGAVALCPRFIIQPFNYYWRRHNREIEAFGVWNAIASPFSASAGDDVSEWRAMRDEPRGLASLFDDYSKLWVIVRSDLSCDSATVETMLAGRGRLVATRGFGRRIELLTFVRINESAGGD